MQDNVNIDIFFEQYMFESGIENICPDDGIISYVKGRVFCNLYSIFEDEIGNGNSDDDEDDGIPFL